MYVSSDSSNKYNIQTSSASNASILTGASIMEDQLNEVGMNSSASTITLPASLDSASSSLQSKLAASGLHSSDSASSAVASTKIINPIDFFTVSDIALFEKATGGTIKDGVFYDKNGNENGTGNGTNVDWSLINTIYLMRAHGAVDARGNSFPVFGDLTAENFKNFIKLYGDQDGSLKMNMLHRAVDVLQTSNT